MNEIHFILGVLISAVFALFFFWKRRNMTAHLGPVKRELKKEKQWLRRGEYNAAMVKGRQNLELLLKLVAEFYGIRLDNTAQAVANAKANQEKGAPSPRRRQSFRGQTVMTHQQFGKWMEANGYLDRVGKWEMNEIRLIGNKAVHENYASKEDAWNQYNYLEDLLKLVSEKHPDRAKRMEAQKNRKSESSRNRQKKKTSGGKKKGNQKKSEGKQPDEKTSEGKKPKKGNQQSEAVGRQPQKIKEQPPENAGKKKPKAQPPEVAEKKKPKAQPPENAEKEKPKAQPPEAAEKKKPKAQPPENAGKKKPKTQPSENEKKPKAQTPQKPKEAEKKQEKLQPADNAAEEKKSAQQEPTQQTAAEAEAQTTVKMSASAKRRARRKRARAARMAQEALEAEKAQKTNAQGNGGTAQKTNARNDIEQETGDKKDVPVALSDAAERKTPSKRRHKPRRKKPMAVSDHGGINETA